MHPNSETDIEAPITSAPPEVEKIIREVIRIEKEHLHADRPRVKGRHFAGDQGGSAVKLLSIKLFNFRQFWGVAELHLAAQAGQSVTVIHGNNGAGKTTLLNAFTWLLYGQHTGAFAAPEQHINQRAIAEAKPGSQVDCWVDLAFEHNGSQYRARRSCSLTAPDGAEQAGRAGAAN